MSSIEYAVRLPIPPSTNNLYRTVVKDGRAFRVRATAYKTWARACPVGGWPGPFPARQAWRVSIDLGQLPHTRDIDNCCKAIIDLICERTGLADQWLDLLLVFRSPSNWGGDCEVVVRWEEE